MANVFRHSPSERHLKRRCCWCRSLIFLRLARRHSFQVDHHDLCRIASHSCRIHPTSCRQLALNEDFVAALDVLFSEFCTVSPRHNLVPLCLWLHHCAVWRCKSSLCCRNRKCSHNLTLIQILYLWIFTYVTYQKKLVYFGLLF